MAIEITEFAQVSIAVSPVGVQGGNFGILGYLGLASDAATNPISPAERARAYTSLASLGADFSALSDTYKAGTAFYGQTPTPTDFVVISNYDAPTPAGLVGGPHDTLEELLAIAGTGGFSITSDLGTDNLSNVNLSAATTLSEVAGELSAVLTSSQVVVTYGAYGFEVATITTGASASITFANGSVALALGLEQHQAQIVEVGLVAETPVESLAAAITKGIDFTGLVTDKSFRDEITGSGAGTTTLEIAQWAEGAKKIFCNTTNSLAVLGSGSADMASIMKDATLRFTLTTFSKNISQYPSASVFGRAASVNFSAIGSTITLNLKQMPGVSAENLTPAEFATLRSKNASAVVKIGKSVNAYTDSRMSSGTWLDTTHGLLWLENRCETDMFNLLYQSPTKVPFTQTGINITVATLDRSLQAAVANGLAGPGFLPDGTYLPEGYDIQAVPLANVPSGDKGNRVYAGLSFRMVGAGALHEVEVSGSFSE